MSICVRSSNHSALNICERWDAKLCSWRTPETMAATSTTRADPTVARKAWTADAKMRASRGRDGEDIRHMLDVELANMVLGEMHIATARSMAPDLEHAMRTRSNVKPYRSRGANVRGTSDRSAVNKLKAFAATGDKQLLTANEGGHVYDNIRAVLIMLMAKQIKEHHAAAFLASYADLFGGVKAAKTTKYDGMFVHTMVFDVIRGYLGPHRDFVCTSFIADVKSKMKTRRSD